MPGSASGPLGLGASIRTALEHLADLRTPPTTVTDGGVEAMLRTCLEHPNQPDRIGPATAAIRTACAHLSAHEYEDAYLALRTAVDHLPRPTHGRRDGHDRHDGHGSREEHGSRDDHPRDSALTRIPAAGDGAWLRPSGRGLSEDGAASDGDRVGVVGDGQQQRHRDQVEIADPDLDNPASG